MCVRSEGCHSSSWNVRSKCHGYNNTLLHAGGQARFAIHWAPLNPTMMHLTSSATSQAVMDVLLVTTNELHTRLAVVSTLPKRF